MFLFVSLIMSFFATIILYPRNLRSSFHYVLTYMVEIEKLDDCLIISSLLVICVPPLDVLKVFGLSLVYCSLKKKCLCMDCFLFILTEIFFFLKKKIANFLNSRKISGTVYLFRASSPFSPFSASKILRYFKKSLSFNAELCYLFGPVFQFSDNLLKFFQSYIVN